MLANVLRLLVISGVCTGGLLFESPNRRDIISRVPQLSVIVSGRPLISVGDKGFLSTDFKYYVHY